MSTAWLTAVFREFPKEALDAEPAVCFVLDDELRLAYCNPAWDLFAQQNSGAPLAGARITGTPVLGCCSGRILAYYRSLYEDVLAGSGPRTHDFHCSSPEQERLMRMHVYGLRKSRGLLVMCSLRVERPHSWPSVAPVEAVYRNSEGFIVMCSNCRRTRRAGIKPETWDWIPGFVSAQPAGISHGLCNTCLEYYYPPDPLNPDPYVL